MSASRWARVRFSCHTGAAVADYIGTRLSGAVGFDVDVATDPMGPGGIDANDVATRDLVADAIQRLLAEWDEGE